MRNAHVHLSSVTLDMGDALELSELLDYPAQWLQVAGDTVRVDLQNFALGRRRDAAGPPAARQLRPAADPWTRHFDTDDLYRDSDGDLDGDLDREQSW